MVERVSAEITFEERKALASLLLLSEATEKTAKIMAKAFEKADRSVKKTTTSLKKTSKASKKAEKGARGISASILDMAKSMTIGNLAAEAVIGSISKLKNFVSDTTVEFINLEKALVGVAKTTGLTGSDLAALEKTINELSTRVPVSIGELLNLAQAAGQLGVKGVDNLTKFTEVMAKLNVATDIAGEEGARAIVRILTITGDGVGTIDRFGAAVTDLGNNFAATEAEIVAVAVRVARSTVQFELGATSVLGISTALKALGVQAEAGGTAIGKAFKAIQKSINDGGTQMERLTKLTGLTGEQLKKTFEKDATRVFRLFIEGLGRVEKSKVTQTLNQMGLSAERVSSVLATLATRANIVGEALDRSNVATRENIALNREAAQAFDTLGSSLDITGNLITKITQKAFKPLGERLKAVTKIFNSLLILADQAEGLELTKLTGALAISIVLDKEKILSTTAVTKRLGELKIKLAEAREEFVKGTSPIRESGIEIDKLERSISVLQKKLDEGLEPLLLRLGKPSDDVITGILDDVLGKLESEAAAKPIVIPFRLEPPDKALLPEDETSVLTEREKRLQSDLIAIREMADLQEGERQLSLSAARGEATEFELFQLREVEEQKIIIKRDADIRRADLTGTAQEKQRAKDKINAKAELDIFKNTTSLMVKGTGERNKKQAISDKEREQNQRDTFNTIATLQGSQNRALATIGKAAALTTIAIDGPVGVGKALAAFPPPFNFIAAAAVGAAFAAQAAKVVGVGGFAGGGIVPGPPNPLGRDNVVANVASGELILNRAQQDAVASQMTSAELMEAMVDRLDILIAKDTSIQIDGREIARTVQEQEKEGFRVTA